ncbi:hypothetical protein AV530_018709 [Patagioenas fasciata monilis]|uniref:Uncharacterized protein n=1 Tax=Patagioenas fasciata monilis TaxID=372326 RepID=A0A1V4JJA0_PATFA|nr:hypothetical protein AV530_018709 [Patagioenas fasciata monilis]
MKPTHYKQNRLCLSVMQSHLGAGYQNIINVHLAKQWEGKTLVRNNLSKDLQHQLHKKKFNFKKADDERFEILKDFTSYGLEHWGSDTQGVEKTRKFLLEWLSFLCRAPTWCQNVDDWIKISEMLLGPVPTSFTFLPKQKANSYR